MYEQQQDFTDVSVAVYGNKFCVVYWIILFLSTTLRHIRFDTLCLFRKQITGMNYGQIVHFPSLHAFFPKNQ